MPRINLFFVVLISVLLSACGFQTPKHTPINVSIKADLNSEFVTKLRKRLDWNMVPSLHVEIGAETQRSQTVSYTQEGGASGYIITLSIPVKIMRGKTLLLSKTITTSTATPLKELESSQAKRLQDEHYLDLLRETALTKLLRILKQLNAD